MIQQGIIREIEQEGAQTKKLLERVPFDRYDWMPHQKSTPLGKLALHIAMIPAWTSRILTIPDFDFLAQKINTPEVRSTADIVKASEENIRQAVADLQRSSDEALMEKWTLRRGEHVIFSLPTLVAIRSIAMNHLVHHRGQLSVYLRLLDVPIPGMYGPSADEGIPS